MKTNRTLTMMGGILTVVWLAMAQDAPPAPPALPAPAPAAIPAPPAPRAPAIAPVPAVAPFVGFDITPEINVQIDDAVRPYLDMASGYSRLAYSQSFADAQEKISQKMVDMQDKVAAVNSKLSAFNSDLAFQTRTFAGSRGSEEGQYNNGLSAIDSHQYDQALTEFNNVIARNGSRAEGALYWKAYVLNKLGRAADAQAAIDTLRKTYPSSHWLDDAKALELEVKQSKGPVSPDAESDEDLKVLALNGLMQSDPEKALPQVQRMLQGSYSPKLKKQALYVIAQSNSAKAQQLLEQEARGGNPDLQVRAIQFLSTKRDANTPQLLLDIYKSTNDVTVKRTILNTFSADRNKDLLLTIARGEKDASLRDSAIGRLGDVDGQPELWQIYQSETSSDAKLSMLNVMRRNGNLEKLAEVARTDKDPKVRQKAIEVIATQDSGTSGNVLVSLYASEQDEKVKQMIIDRATNGRDCRPLIDIAKAEKNLQLKLRIVQRLSGMTKSCPAATDYLTELLNK